MNIKVLVNYVFVVRRNRHFDFSNLYATIKLRERIYTTIVMIRLFLQQEGKYNLNILMNTS